jgi:hypothetical protein
MEKENLLKQFEDTKMWKHRSPDLPDKHHHFYSKMKGFTDGRYTIKIRELLRKSKGFKYKIFIYYTPYNPNNLVFQGMFNDWKELTDIIKSVNPKLLDNSRKY